MTYSFNGRGDQLKIVMLLFGVAYTFEFIVGLSRQYRIEYIIYVVADFSFFHILFCLIIAYLKPVKMQLWVLEFSQIIIFFSSKKSSLM